jgi:hypothetical protein
LARERALGRSATVCRGLRDVRKPIPSETGGAETVDLTVRRGGFEAVTAIRHEGHVDRLRWRDCYWANSEASRCHMPRAEPVASRLQPLAPKRRCRPVAASGATGRNAGLGSKVRLAAALGRSLSIQRRRAFRRASACLRSWPSERGAALRRSSPRTLSLRRSLTKPRTLRYQSRSPSGAAHITRIALSA